MNIRASTTTLNLVATRFFSVSLSCGQYVLVELEFDRRIRNVDR